jgi:hypothetical protein
MSSGDARRGLIPAAELERTPGGDAVVDWVVRCTVIRAGSASSALAGGSSVPPSAFVLVVDEVDVIAAGQAMQACVRSVLADLIARCRDGSLPGLPSPCPAPACAEINQATTWPMS